MIQGIPPWIIHRGVLLNTFKTRKSVTAIAAQRAVSAEKFVAHPIMHHADIMSPQAAAAYLGIEASTLAMWRSTKRYPLTYIKVGRLVQYRKAHLDAFLALRTVEPAL